MIDEQTRLAIDALKAAGCGVLAIHVQSRIADLHKEKFELVKLLDESCAKLTQCADRIEALEKVKTYNIGEATNRLVFQASGIENVGDMQRVFDVVEVALEALEKDAARYRFAKSNKSQGKSDIVIVHKIWGGDQMYLSGDKADEAIDTAMQSEKWGV